MSSATLDADCSERHLMVPAGTVQIAGPITCHKLWQQNNSGLWQVGLEV